MKKILTILASFAAMAMTAISCDMIPSKDECGQDYSYLQGQYYPTVVMDPLYVMLPGTQTNLTVKAEADNKEVAGTPMKVTFTVNPDLVAQFNADNDSSGVFFPAEAYELGMDEAIMPRFGRASSSVSLKISCNGMEDDQLYVLPVVVDKISGEGNAVPKEGKAVYVLVRKAYVEPGKGSGTKEDPWLITDVDDFKEMSLKLVADKTVYFKLANDIDASEIENWVPLNTVDPYKMRVDFNGNGHKISNLKSKGTQYASIFGVLYGSCYDLYVDNAEIEATSACGVIGGYLGTGELGCTVTNVHVTNSKVTQKGSTTGVGGFAGRASAATIDRCSFEGDVVSPKNYAGGFLGYDSGTGVVISNCYSAGTVRGDQRCGGFMGGLIKTGTTIINCYSTAALDATYGFGGIVGHTCLDKGTPLTMVPDNTITGCIAWNEHLRTTKTPTADASFSHYSCGAIVGFTAIANNYSNCVRKPDMDFVSYSTCEILEDQPNFTTTSPISVGVCPSYHYPYNGVAAAAGKTLSDVARDLGWSMEIWDLSGEVPVFK